MSHLLLSHLSAENNSPDIVRELFTKKAGQTEIMVASRFEESAVLQITERASEPGRRVLPPMKTFQLGLFQ
jgi:hypothetical protein